MYGTAGYDVFDSSVDSLLVDPTGVVITQLASYDFGGDPSYTQIDNPTGSGTITSGVAYFNPISTGQILDYVSLQFTAAENYVLGIYTDNADYAGISPSALRVYQTSGTGSGDSGDIANTPSLGGDWFFFNVSANAGDVVNIEGIAVSNPSHSSGISLITFDSGLDPVAPEPGTISLLLAGLAVLAWHRRGKQARP